MDEIDMLLSIVENPTRRRILEALVREPHYPLQLSKELGVSQQAVMKNLSLMEQSGMVVSYRTSSNMGPMRTLYVPATEFTLVIDMHNSMFRTRLIESADRDAPDAQFGDIEEASARIDELDARLAELDKQRAELIEERNSVMSWVTERIKENGDYGERKALYESFDGRREADSPRGNRR
jgi:predicted transcriptional regulator